MKNDSTILDIKELSKLTPLKIVKSIKGGLRIRFEDDVVVKLNRRDIVLSIYYWNILFKYPVKITSDLSMDKFYKNNLYGADAHIDFLYKINCKIIKEYVKTKLGKNDIMEEIHSTIHDTVELIYMELAENLKEYQMSIDAVDLLDIQFKKEIMDSIERVREEMTIESIQQAHIIFDKVVREDETLRDNPAVIAYLSGAVNGGQMKNMLSSNGFKVDSTGKIFPYPIAESFMLGMSNMYSVTIESRTAVKSLYLSTKAIQSTETLAKAIQLITMYIERVRIDDDCKSTSYVEWYVDEKDLNNLLGSYYLNESNNTLEVITDEHRHLIGKRIKIRNAIGCKHWDKHAVCGVCFGDLAYQISKTSNLGHYSGVNPTGQTTQLSLKTKHHNDSAAAEAISLDDLSSKFFNIRNKNTYCFNNILLEEGDKAYIVAPQEFLYGIKDIDNDILNKIDIFKVTKIVYVDYEIESKEKTVKSYRLDIRVGNRFGTLTQKMLKYLIDNNNYEVISGNRYRIDITKIILAKNRDSFPFLVLPDIEYNYLSLAKDLEKLLKKVTLKENAHTFLIKLYNLINSKLKINIAYIGVITRALMIEAFDYKLNLRDFNLPSPENDEARVGKMVDVIRGRSLSNALLHGYVRQIMTNAYSFSAENRCNSKLDVLFKPEESIAWAKKRNKVMEERKYEMIRDELRGEIKNDRRKR